MLTSMLISVVGLFREPWNRSGNLLFFVSGPWSFLCDMMIATAANVPPIFLCFSSKEMGLAAIPWGECED